MENKHTDQYSAGTARSFFYIWLCICLLFLLGLVFFAITMYNTTIFIGEAHPLAVDREAALDLEAGKPVEVPLFTDDARYVLAGFSLQGLRQIGTVEGFWDLNGPGNIFAAQLIERNSLPMIQTKGFTVRYTVEGNNVVEGAEVSGDCTLAEDGLSFVSPAIRILPNTKDHQFEPFPMVKLEAFDDKGNMVAWTLMTLPVTSEMGCVNCHKGVAEQGSTVNVSRTTALDILSIHDRRNNTGLERQALAGQPINCRNCHAKDSSVMNLSAAIHGFHATMQPAGSDSCVSCHPRVAHFQRDIHASMGFSCANCHGEMEDHALALLKSEADAGKQTAQRRLAGITPQSVATVGEIIARQPYENMPDCTTCHNFIDGASSASAFNTWTKDASERFSRRFDNAGVLRCGSCHGPVHATYEATNPHGDDRDNVQPLQYQKLPMPLGADKNCAVCHTQDMEFSIHHDRM